MEYTATIDRNEFKRLVDMAESAIQEMVDACELVDDNDGGADIDRPSSANVTRAAKDLVNQLLSELEIGS